MGDEELEEEGEMGLSMSWYGVWEWADEGHEGETQPG